MNLILIPRKAALSDGLLKFALSSDLLRRLLFETLSSCSPPAGNPGPPRPLIRTSPRTAYAIPRELDLKPPAANRNPLLLRYAEQILLDEQLLRTTHRDPWFIVSNGRFAARLNCELLRKILASSAADIVAVNTEPQLRAGRDRVRLTTAGEVAGFRRLYGDSAEPAPLPHDWPHHLFMRSDTLDRILVDGTLAESFPEMLKKWRATGLRLQAINVAGASLDLETEEGLLALCSAGISAVLKKARRQTAANPSGRYLDRTDRRLRKPRFVGEVLLGRNVRLGPDVVLIGPTVIDDGVELGPGAVINRAIIAAGLRVRPGQLVRNRVLRTPPTPRRNQRHSTPQSAKPCIRLDARLPSDQADELFRKWGRFSYPVFFKRILDLVAAVIVLVLFAPLLPFIAAAIKLTSPGPVFYKDRRQGLHGKLFNCLKFRTMHVGADRIQERLRPVSQVDGPQFKIANDPRISAVGKFLRDTFIDEVPQFLNVLLGQMSVVGPRPSPETENTLCPAWRDARLSVRPGITGLWQVRRTRKPDRDFQEWIYYDTTYVRKLSLRMDLWICWQTTKKIVRSFVSQF